MDIEFLNEDIVLPNNSYVFVNLPSIFCDFNNHTGVVKASHVSVDENDQLGWRQIHYLVSFPKEEIVTWVSHWDVVGYLTAA